ncbi:MAG TPA: sigma-54-dependent Fis family transcriptional regulator [Desulfobacteria bacterium]|nr:sigma-54-dependent Fis family transcriptional regulator [Desulfobacteria bacterium]
MDSNSLALWNQFIDLGTVEEKLDPVIKRSWERSRDFKVNYEYIEKTEVLGPTRLRERVDERQHLLEVAVPVMEELHAMLKGMGFMVLLADHEGYILKTIMDEGFYRQAKPLMLCEGANWSERSKGTNAIGTSLAEGAPVKVIAHQHFVRQNHVLACAAVPILGSKGQVLGTLDVTGESRRANGLIYRMVNMSAKNIQREFQMLNLHRKLDLYKAKYDGLFGLMREGAVVVDEDGTIQELSPSASKVLGISTDDVVGGNIEELFNLNSMWVLDSSSRDTREITISPKNSSSLVNARARRIYGPNGQPEGLVAIVGTSGEKMTRDSKILPAVHGNVSSVRFTFDQIIGKSEYLQQVISMCKRVARNNSTILLTGETGTGKEMLAQSIHSESICSDGPFIAVNCAAIPSELIESELFGYEDGAFTGARKGGSPGKFELANGGTIFLDEIGDMSARAQVSLLRVLQEKQLCRVGGRQNKPVDVRVIAATHRSLQDMVDEGLFRQDLFFRLNVVNIYIPPLRNRKVDIELLMNFFLEKYKNTMGRPQLEISPEAKERFLAYRWPGNVRELENMVEGLVNVVEGEIIYPEHLPTVLIEGSVDHLTDAKGTTLKDMERIAIIQAVKECAGSLSAAARKLDIGRSTLYRKIKEYGIVLEES